MADYRYKAFISYSHADERWARWFHRRLEHYRIPRKLVGQVTAVGAIPKRLQPVFRDREELSSAADLSSEVKQALRDSGALVVICSPAAAASRWVEEEIREFQRLGRGDRIFAVIVDGDPQGRDGAQCFPPAMRHAEDGTAIEPLAADARKWADGRLLALLKLVAGVLGIPLDSLRRRDLQQRQRKWVLTTVAAVLVALVTTLAVTTRISAQKSRASAEQLVGFKLNELSSLIDTLAPESDSARLKAWDEAALQGLVKENSASGDPLEAARALREAGIEQWRTGAPDAAGEAFRQSWALIAQGLNADRNDEELLFEYGQAEYWLGQVAMDRGDIEATEQSFLRYAGVARRLLRASPENAEWVLEMTYALSNLGGIYIRQRQYDPIKARRFLQAALEFNQIALVLDPGNAFFETELEQSHAYLADAHLRVCDLGGALHSRMEGVSLARKVHQDSEDPARTSRFLGFALGGVAGVQSSIGLSDTAGESLRESIEWLELSRSLDPENRALQDLLLERRARLLFNEWSRRTGGDFTAAAEELDRAWQVQPGSDGGHTPDSIGRYAGFLLIREDIARAAGDEALADEVLDRALALMDAQIEATPQVVPLREQLFEAVFRYFQRKGRLPDPRYLEKIPDYDDQLTRTPSCEQIRLAAKQALLEGRTADAKTYTNELLDKGYFAPAFIAFCREYGLCAVE